MNTVDPIVLVDAEDLRCRISGNCTGRGGHRRAAGIAGFLRLFLDDGLEGVMTHHLRVVLELGLPRDAPFKLEDVQVPFFRLRCIQACMDTCNQQDDR